MWLTYIIYKTKTNTNYAVRFSLPSSELTTREKLHGSVDVLDGLLINRVNEALRAMA